MRPIASESVSNQLAVGHEVHPDWIVGRHFLYFSVLADKILIP